MNDSPMTRLPTEQQELLEESLSEVYESFEAGLRKESDIAALLDQKVQPGALDNLKAGHSVRILDGTVEIAPESEKLARKVIRRKRLAERLLKDVLNLREESIDPAACQWEHILSAEVTDSICTLLGHPTESPRGRPIPPGECCRSEAQAVTPLVRSLDHVNAGTRAKISYLATKENQELHRLLSMGLVPGAVVELVQRFPTFVVQVGESQLAFDETIASSIFVHPLG